MLPIGPPGSSALKTILLLFVFYGDFSRVEGAEKKSETRRFNLTADMTFASKYMTDGFKVGGDHAVWQPSVGLNLASTGLSVVFWSNWQVDRTHRRFDELDFFVIYGHEFSSRTWHAIHLHGFFDYWVYPQPNVVDDGFGHTIELPGLRGNKLHVGFSLPQLVPLLGSYLIPAYNVYYWLYWEGNRKDRFQGGARHEVLLRYTREVGRWILGTSSSLNFNDGAFGVQAGWSHWVAQIYSGFYAWDCYFSGTLNQQWSFQKTVDPRNEFWPTLSVSKTF